MLFSVPPSVYASQPVTYFDLPALPHLSRPVPRRSTRWRITFIYLGLSAPFTSAAYTPSAQPRPQAIVYRANVQGDGSLDGWTPVSSLPIATSWHEAVVDKNYLYVVGGAIGSGRTRQVYFAAFGPNGELGAWRETTPLPLELANHTAVVIADVIYVAGGLPNADTSQSSVYSAAINSDGTLGAWQEVTALAQGLHDHSAAAVDRSMFIIGGFNTAKGKYSDAVYAASVQCE